MGLPAYAAVQLGLGAAQMVSGLFKKKKKLPKPRISSATISAENEARQMKNATRAAGADVAEENLLRSQANAVSSARQAFKDPNKIAAAIAQSQAQTNKGMRSLDAAAQAQRLQGQQNLVNVLGRKGQEEVAIQQEMQRRAIEENNIKQQRIAAGMQTLGSFAKDAMMIDAKQKIDAGEEWSMFGGKKTISE